MKKRIQQACARNGQAKGSHKLKRKAKQAYTWDWMLLCCHRHCLRPVLKIQGVMSISFVSFLSLYLSPSFLLFYSFSVKWTTLLLWGRVAHLPVVVRLCMNQSSDRAAGRMADAMARKLFNQAALPSHGQGEPLYCWIKKGSSTHYCIHTSTCVQTSFNLADYLGE